MTKLEELKKAKAEIAALKKETAKKVKSIFNDAVADLFKDHPNLTEIRWTQYTPYFNDGDTCEFGSSHDYADINGVGDCYDDDEDDQDENGESKKQKAWDDLGEAEQKKLQDAVNSFMENWDSDDMLDLFGDHAEVKITRAGIEVSEYEHD